MNPTTDAQHPSLSHLLAVGDVEEARRRAQAALDRDPAEPEARSVLARLALLDLDLEKAQALLEGAASEAHEGLRLAKAGVAALEGNDARARELFQGVLADNEAAVEARFGLGISLARAGQIPEALVELRQAAEQVPESGHLKYHLGRCQLEAGEVEAAVLSLGDAVRLDPFLPDAWVALARVASVSGQKERAVELLEEGLSVLPNQAALLTELAQVRISSGQIQEGLDALHQVSSVAPQDPDAAANEALRLIAIGKAQDAIEYCRTKRERGVWGAGLACALAEAYEMANDAPSAMVAYGEAISLDEDDWRAPNNLGLLLASHGTFDQLSLAVEALETAHHRAPQQLEPLLNLALVYARMEHLETAVHLARHVASFELGAKHPIHEQAVRLLTALES